MVDYYKRPEGSTPGVHLSHVQLIDFGNTPVSPKPIQGAMMLDRAILEGVVSHHAAGYAFHVINSNVRNCFSYKGSMSNFKVEGFGGELENNIAMITFHPMSPHKTANFRGQTWNTYSQLAHGVGPPRYPTLVWHHTVGNAAAASDGFGFNGHFDWGEGNVAHSNLIGIVAPSEARHPLKDVVVWRGATFGIWTYNVHVDKHVRSPHNLYRLTGPPIVERVTVVDCTVALYIAVKANYEPMVKNFGALAALDRSYAMPTIVRQSLFVGHSANYRDEGIGCSKAAFTRPPKKNGKHTTWGANRHVTGLFNPYYGLGMSEPGVMDWDVGKPDANMVGGWADGPMTQMPGGQVRHGEIHYTQNTYANYFPRCGRGARVLEVNIHSHDHNPPTHLSASSLPGSNPQNRMWIPEPRVMDITLQACLRMDCDGPKQAMFIDVDGTFTGLAPGNHIMARADFFNVQVLPTVATRNVAVLTVTVTVL